MRLETLNKGLIMANKVVIITGASRGIGRTVALEMAKNGYDVVLTYNTNEQKAREVEQTILSMNAKCLVLKCDISIEEDVKYLVWQTEKTFGHIDVLINNASIAIDSLFCDKSCEEFKRTLDVNLVGTFMVSKYVGEVMCKNKNGKIINITSTNGINTYYPMCIDYDASKAGIISLTHNLAIQFAPYVNVNAVAPGFIATESEIKDMDEEFIKNEEEKVFLKRAGTEQDVANLILFLASDKANYINNEVIRIDGGMYGTY